MKRTCIDVLRRASGIFLNLPPDAPLDRGAFVLQEKIIKNQLPPNVIEAMEKSAFRPQLEQSTPKTREIANPEKDKTTIILNFILREVLPIKDRQKQKELLIYFFKSILSETQKLPVTHLAYEITKTENGEIALHDDVYQLRPDLLQICKEAVESLAINQAEKARYGLEKKQIEELLKTLEDIFSLAPHAVLSLLSEENEQINPSETKEQLESTGWKTFSPRKSFSFIRPEVKEKMGIEGCSGEITVGEKYLYVMPQSAVHEGNMSIIVIAQPVYIPELNRFILLHDQHASPKDWKEHAKLFKSLGINIPSDFDSLEFSEKEELIMKTQVTLPQNLQEKTAEDSFLTIFPEKKFFKKLRQKITRKKIKNMEPALNEYSELLIDVMENEISKDPSLTPPTVEKLGNFMKRVILAGILDTKKISNKKRESLFSHIKKLGNLGEKEFAISLAKGVGFSSALKAFDVSLLECVALSPISGIGQLAKLQMEGVDIASLTKFDLEKFVGEKRIKDWKMGSCIRCGKATWIGECNWCLSCETNYDSSTTPNTNWSSPLKTSKKRVKKPAVGSDRTESFGSFVAGLI
jgi:hypothetical protein